MLVRLKFLTAGESHGQGLLGILDGMTSNLEISEEYINIQLARRQMGHGRGGRMKIEKDKGEFFYLNIPIEGGYFLNQTVSFEFGKKEELFLKYMSKQKIKWKKIKLIPEKSELKIMIG